MIDRLSEVIISEREGDRDIYMYVKVYLIIAIYLSNLLNSEAHDYFTRWLNEILCARVNP